MPRKKEEYSTLDQIVNALLKKEKLDDSKYQKLQNSIKIIIAANVDEVVRDYLNKCLVIKQDVSNLLALINEANTSDAIKKLCEKVGLIGREIEGIDINQIKLGIETKKVKTQINSIKEDFQSNIEKFREKLKQKENELEEENKMVQAQKELSDASSSEASSDQSRAEETGAVPKRKNSNNKEGNKQCSIRHREDRKDREQKAKQEAERLQKEKEKNYPNFKEKLTNYLEIVNRLIILSLFYEIKKVYNKQNNIPNTQYISDKDYKKFDKLLCDHIKSYYTIVLSEHLLEKNCIDFNVEKFKKNCQKDYQTQINGEKLTVLLNKARNIISNEYGAAIDILKLLESVPDVKDAENIENRLIEALPNLYQSLLNQLKEKCNLVLQCGDDISSDEALSGKIMYDELYDKVLHNDCAGDVKNSQELLEQVMDESGYKAEVDKVLEKLMKQYSPSSSVEELSAESQGACAQVGK
ncbi:MAG: hypothetical protein U0X86_000993 [Wolbachia endosymbiont of Xenopsylla cheopis]